LVVGEVSAIPILGALASSPLPANMEASRAAGDGLHPRPSAPGAPHRAVWSSSSSVARDPEISSTWLAKCRQSRHARLPHGSWGMLLGALASSPSPAKVEASHRQVGPVPRFAPRFPTRASSRIFVPTGACLGVLAAVRLPRRSNASWDGGRLACLPRALPTTSPQAASVVGPSALLPWPRSFPVLHTHREGIPLSRTSRFRPALHPSGPRRGVDLKAPAVSHVPRTAARARSLAHCVVARSLGCGTHGGYEASASVCPESKRSAASCERRPATVLGSSHAGGGVGEECYLVDPASSHMLVSKIKPCMCNYSLFDGTCYSDNRSNSRANTCNKPRLLEGMHLLDKRSTRAPPVAAMIHDNSTDRTALVPATHHSNFCPINFRWVRFRRGSLRNGYHIQGRQQARKLPNPDTGRIHWRASLVPAAAVIPAPIAWTLGWAGRSASGVHRSSRPFCRRCAPGLNWPGRASGAVTLKKLECSKQAYALYTLAWDNIIGFRSYYVGLRDRTFAKDVFINQERKLGARRRSDTVLVSTINDADQGSADVAFRTPPAPYEKSKSLGSGGSMVARLKLKGIDGRAPPGVEPAA
ncbi:UNVERIFIED_CONTAM: hypothetical protein Sindi_3115500, partial [Sesamum indicum]